MRRDFTADRAGRLWLTDITQHRTVESFFGSMQIELVGQRTWATRAELASAFFEWIEEFCNPV